MALGRSWPEPERKQGNAPNGLPYESVWDYPRPPAIRPEIRKVTVMGGDVLIASSEAALRICETAGAPVIYLPEDDIDLIRRLDGWKDARPLRGRLGV